jgi:hypothetical protein
MGKQAQDPPLKREGRQQVSKPSTTRYAVDTHFYQDEMAGQRYAETLAEAKTIARLSYANMALRYSRWKDAYVIVYPVTDGQPGDVVFRVDKDTD